MLRTFIAGAERCIAKGRIVVRPVETSDSTLRCGKNRKEFRYFVASNALWDRFKFVRLVKMLGMVRL
jgi:hypothetical protein